DSHEGHGRSVPGDTFAFQESSDRRELPRVNVHTVSIGGNVISRLSTKTHHVLDTTTMPLSRVFDHFRNLGLNVFGSDYMCDRQPIEDRQIQTTPVETAAPIIRQILFTRVDEGGCVRTDPLITASLDERFYPHRICAEAPIIRQILFTRVDEGGVRTDPLITASLDERFYPHRICAEGVGSHISLSSTTAPVNHVYLCLNVTDCIIRPEIIPSRNSGLENAYQSHAWEENLDTIGPMSRHNEVFAANEGSTSGTQ
nr:hypothetical protein [Tanacetum cinerariifolium]